jgi:hypothetical protein
MSLRVQCMHLIECRTLQRWHAYSKLGIYSVDTTQQL